MMCRLKMSAVILLLASTALAADYTARTAPKIIDESLVGHDRLDVMLKPLEVSELEIEADAWLATLKKIVHEISEEEVAVMLSNADQDAATDAGQSTDAAAVDELKKASLKKLVELREDRTMVLDRLNVVLDALEAKGGDPEPYRLYATEASGTKVDIFDPEAMRQLVLGWLKSPEGGIRWGLNIISFIAVLVVFWIASKIATRAAARALGMARNVSTLLRDFCITLVRRSVMIIGLLIALSMLEINIGPVLALITAAGFVIGFALQGTLSNFASGLLILIYRPFDVGDVISAGGTSGKVDSMTLVSTCILTFDNQKVVVPNNSVWGDVITNVTGLPIRRVDMKFGIGYEDDIEQAKRILLEVASSHPKVLTDPAPVVQLHELADSSLNFICRPWSKTGDYWDVYWDVTQSVKERFDKAGISIPFPQRDVHLYEEKKMESSK